MNTQQKATRALALASQATRHPSWAAAHLRNLADRFRDGLHNGSSWEAPTQISVTESLTEVGGWPESDVEAALDEMRMPQRPETTTFLGDPDGSRELALLAYGWCRLARPRLVLETGVAHGFSTAAVLQALDRNNDGRLISIDLPHLHPKALSTIGLAVEPRLRSRWQLWLGGASGTIPRAIANAEQPVDLFIQDASHTRAGQLAEYRVAWPHLAPTGLLLSDDVSETFALFAAGVGRVPTYVKQPKSRPIGLLRK